MLETTFLQIHNGGEEYDPVFKCLNCKSEYSCNPARKSWGYCPNCGDHIRWEHRDCKRRHNYRDITAGHWTKLEAGGGITLFKAVPCFQLFIEARFNDGDEWENDTPFTGSGGPHRAIKGLWLKVKRYNQNLLQRRVSIRPSAPLPLP